MTLTDLANKFETDKGTTFGDAHGYTEGYEPLLEPLRDSAIRLLEIGVVLRPPAGARSMRMWREYYPQADLFAMDVLSCDDFGVEGAKFFQGDASDPCHLMLMYHQFGGQPFDLIIEDADHSPMVQQVAFGWLFDCVKPGGLYIIEDILNPAFEGENEWSGLNNQSTHKMLTKQPMRNAYSSPRRLDHVAAQVESVQFIKDKSGKFLSAIVRKKI